ncbi:hypothetical protein M427DRAFT_195788 [Gonapodya prolifera JEL478]|uniref:Cyclin-D1-binding protein 1-like C-terminal domain-containing protein n=1 Tax=Gonapodya prolifera (strain JEL478) TaxID=1344416 RepID=A0A139APC4_GONPJ|nr:hypothetical protein M427DRAFT_195788 [Gonapodya prolifera JEL478]|eukprot:KXS18607.1 hypothetical protein M427DRAFT_195788 [Gonapodya prolifera JEL478]
MKVLQGLLDDALEETEDSLINEGDSGTEGDDSDGEGGNGNEDLFDHKLTARERAVIQLVVSLVKLVKMTFKKLVIRTFVDVLDDTEDNVQWYDAIWEKATSVSSKVDDLAGTAQSPPFSNDEIATESSALISECEQLCSLAESKTEGVHAVWWQNAKQQLRKAQSSFSNVPSLENGTPHGKEHSEVCMYLK